jgi:hypothetical protein
MFQDVVHGWTRRFSAAKIKVALQVQVVSKALFKTTEDSGMDLKTQKLKQMRLLRLPMT